MIDVVAFTALLDEVALAEEKIADRGPIKVLPRPPSEVPNVPVLRAYVEAIQQSLRVRRNYTTAKGHDLPGPAAGVSYDLAAVGVVDHVKEVPAGKDRCYPDCTTLVRVEFPSGEHLWFDPKDLEAVP